MYQNLAKLKLLNLRQCTVLLNRHQHHEALKPSTSLNVDWNRAVLEAEKVVGYPTSFLNLRWLLNDEIANIAQHLKRLIGTEHPILNTARGILTNQLPAWGLIVLLVSKSVGLNKTVDQIEKDASSGILHTQRILAEITEMIRTSYLIHKGLLNINGDKTNDSIADPALKDDLHFGNKIALLSGDYLLSKSYQELANIKNQDVSELISAALRDMTECEFMGLRDGQNKAIPSQPNLTQIHVQIFDGNGKFITEWFRGAMSRDECFRGAVKNTPITTEQAMGNMASEWTVRNLLGGATLLAKSCQSAIKLAGFNADTEQNGYRFGKHLALAWQASIDLLEFQPGKCGRFNLVGAPLMYHLGHAPNDYSFISANGLSDISCVDYRALRCVISDGPALRMTEDLRKRHATNASEVLDSLAGEPSEAKTALKNIIGAM